MSGKPKLIELSDIIFTASIAVCAVIMLFYLRLASAGGAEVQFRRNGELLATLPLAKDNLYEINGNYRNVFEIKDGKASVRFTDCPSKSCAHSGAISAPGEVIVCAPNGVTASITGMTEGIDALTG